MVFIPAIHHRPSLTPTRHSRELGQRFDDAVREYRRLNPELTDADVRTALATSLQQTGAPEDEARQRRVAIAVVAAIVAVFMGVALSVGQQEQNSDSFVWIAAVVAAAAGIGIAAIRLSRRE